MLFGGPEYREDPSVRARREAHEDLTGNMAFAEANFGEETDDPDTRMWDSHAGLLTMYACRTPNRSDGVQQIIIEAPSARMLEAIKRLGFADVNGANIAGLHFMVHPAPRYPSGGCHEVQCWALGEDFEAGLWSRYDTFNEVATAGGVFERDKPVHPKIRQLRTLGWKLLEKAFGK